MGYGIHGCGSRSRSGDRDRNRSVEIYDCRCKNSDLFGSGLVRRTGIGVFLDYMLRMKRPLSWPLSLFGQNLVPFLRGTDLEMRPVTEGYSGRIRKIIGNFGIPEHVCRMGAYSLCAFKICRCPEYYRVRPSGSGSVVSPMRLFPEYGASVRLVASSALPDPPVRIRETENIEPCGGFCRRADVGRAEVFPAFLEGNMFRYVSAPAGALRKSHSVDEKRRDGSLSAMVSFRS